jgi:hypothetical protein
LSRQQFESRPASDTPGWANGKSIVVCVAHPAVRDRVPQWIPELGRDLARPPTVHEFLQRRAAADRSLPSLGTLYKIFPGGWASIVDAASLTPGAVPAEPGSSP